MMPGQTLSLFTKRHTAVVTIADFLLPHWRAQSFIRYYPTLRKRDKPEEREEFCRCKR